MWMRQTELMACALALSALAVAHPASALTMQECSAKYKAEKKAGTLSAKNWNEFRKAECGTGAALEPKSAKAAEPKTKRSGVFKPTAAKDLPPPAKAEHAHGLTMKECGKRYQAAKSSGSLGATTWNEFRQAQCGVDAAALPDLVRAGSAVFPRNIARRYADLSAGKARRKTCLDQYRANKAAGENGGMKWVQKGGGYYSECNRILRQKLGNAQ
jgi:hypothetical protein